MGRGLRVLLGVCVALTLMAMVYSQAPTFSSPCTASAAEKNFTARIVAPWSNPDPKDAHFYAENVMFEPPKTFVFFYEGAAPQLPKCPMRGYEFEARPLTEFRESLCEWRIKKHAVVAQGLFSNNLYHQWVNGGGPERKWHREHNIQLDKGAFLLYAEPPGWMKFMGREIFKIFRILAPEAPLITLTEVQNNICFSKAFLQVSTYPKSMLGGDKLDLNYYVANIGAALGLRPRTPRTKGHYRVTVMDRGSYSHTTQTGLWNAARMWVNVGEISRRIANDTRFSVVLAKPGDMTMEAQVRLIQNTDIMIGVYGATLAHGMHLPPGAAFLGILPFPYNHDWYKHEMGGSVYYVARNRGDLSRVVLSKLPTVDCAVVTERQLVYLPEHLRNSSQAVLRERLTRGLKDTPRGGGNQSDWERLVSSAAIRVPWEWMQKELNDAVSAIDAWKPGVETQAVAH